MNLEVYIASFYRTFLAKTLLSSKPIKARGPLRDDGHSHPQFAHLSQSLEFSPSFEMTSSPTQTSPSFFKDEFERALSEQAFGISKYEITSSSALDASATIELLEKSKLEVNLSIRGYQVCLKANISY